MRQQIGQHDAAAAFIGHAPAIGTDHQAGLCQRIDHGEWPEHGVSGAGDGVAVHRMAVKRPKTAQLRTRRLRHAQAIAHGRGRGANQQSVRARRDVAANHFDIGTESAVGNDHGPGIETFKLSANHGLDTGACAVGDGKRFGIRTADKPAAAIFQIGFELAQQVIRAVAFPVQALLEASRRRKHDAFAGGGVDENIFAAFGDQPVDGAARVVGEGFRQCRVGFALGALVDDFKQFFSGQAHVLKQDVGDAGGVTRIVQVALAGFLFEHRGAQAQLRAAVGRNQAGETAADGNDVKLHLPRRVRDR